MPNQGAQPAPAESAPAGTPREPRLPEKAVKGSWNLIKGVTGFFWRRIKGVTQAAWDMTGGQVTAEIAEAGKRVGFESKEEGFLGQIGEIILATSKKIEAVVGGIGGVVKYGAGMPFRMVARVPKALQYAKNVIFGKKNGTANASAAESHTKPAEAHGQ